MRIDRTLAIWGLAASVFSTIGFGLLTILLPALAERQGMTLMLGIVLLCCVPALVLILRDFGNIEMPILVFSTVVVAVIVVLGLVTYQWLSALAGEMEVIYRSPVTAFYATISMVGLWVSTGLSLLRLGSFKGLIFGPVWVGTPAFFLTTVLLALRFI